MLGGARRFDDHRGRRGAGDISCRPPAYSLLLLKTTEHKLTTATNKPYSFGDVRVGPQQL